MTCDHSRSQVIDSRPRGDGKAHPAFWSYVRWRKRECLDCKARFDTYEMTRQGVRDAIKAGR